MRILIFITSVVLIALTTDLRAQCTRSLTSGTWITSAAPGQLFDITTTTPVTICSFDVHISSTAIPRVHENLEIEVWMVTGGGSWVGNQGSEANWTLITTTVVNGAERALTPLNLDLGVRIPAGGTQGFHLYTPTSRGILNYRFTGNPIGSVVATDGTLSILAGATGTSRFQERFTPRPFGGRVHYNREFSLSYSQPVPGGLDVTVLDGPPNLYYINVFTVDPANANGGLGSGWWGGLHISPLELSYQLTLNFAPFQGTLDGDGAYSFSYPAGSFSGAAGTTIYANVHAIDLSQGFAFADVTDPVAFTLQ